MQQEHRTQCAGIFFWNECGEVFHLHRMLDFWAIRVQREDHARCARGTSPSHGFGNLRCASTMYISVVASYRFASIVFTWLLVVTNFLRHPFETSFPWGVSMWAEVRTLRNLWHIADDHEQLWSSGIARSTSPWQGAFQVKVNSCKLPISLIMIWAT